MNEWMDGWTTDIADNIPRGGSRNHRVDFTVVSPNFKPYPIRVRIYSAGWNLHQRVIYSPGYGLSGENFEVVLSRLDGSSPRGPRHAPIAETHSIVPVHEARARPSTNEVARIHIVN